VAGRVSDVTGYCEKLRRLLASYGLPEQIVTDNATTFTSEEFQILINSLVERYVQTLKAGMKKLNTTMDIDDRLSMFLLQYRTTPNCTTEQSPADSSK